VYRDILRSIDEQARAKNPQGGSPLPPPGYDYSAQPSPAAGTDEPPEDYLDQGQAPIPAEGYTGGIDLAGPDVSVIRLGKDKATLHQLASSQMEKEAGAQQRAKTIADYVAEGQEPGIGRLRALADNEDKMASSDYLNAGREAMRHLEEAGRISYGADGSLNATDMSADDARKLRNLNDRMHSIAEWQDVITGDGGGSSSGGDRLWDPQEDPSIGTHEWRSSIEDELRKTRRGIGGG